MINRFTPGGIAVRPFSHAYRHLPGFREIDFQFADFMVRLATTALSPHMPEEDVSATKKNMRLTLPHASPHASENENENGPALFCLFHSGLLLSYLTGLRNSAMDLKQMAGKPLENCLETEEKIPPTGISLPFYDEWIKLLQYYPSVVARVPSILAISKTSRASTPFLMDNLNDPDVAQREKTDPAPLLLDDEGRLYLSRYWHYEHRVAQTVISRSMARPIPLTRTDLLTRLFPTTSDPQKNRENMSHDGVSSPAEKVPPAASENAHHEGESHRADSMKRGPQNIAQADQDKPFQLKQIDWQKVACLAAQQSGFTVISGGPGTGKTTTVSKLLALILNETPALKVDLVAPTGKAADRLVKSIQSAKAHLDIPPAIKEKIPDSARTIHRYLKFHPASGTFRHHRGNQQNSDLLVVDEASMVSLPLFAHLFDALKPSARIILLGDKDQLSSVENGSVFADLSSEPFVNRFSEDFIEKNRRFIPELFSDREPHTDENKTGALLRDRVIHLTHSYRFGADSGIGHLSFLINHHTPSDTMTFLKTRQLPKSAVATMVDNGKPASKSGEFEDILWYDLPADHAGSDVEERLSDLLSQDAVNRFQHYMDALDRFHQRHAPSVKAHASFSKVHIPPPSSVETAFFEIKNVETVDDERGGQASKSKGIKDTFRFQNGTGDQEMAADVLTVLDAFERFRILCALNRGPFGVEAINDRMESLLFGRKQDLFYSGRPVMVLTNDYTQQLFNGDIGVILEGRDGQRRAWFRGEGDTVRRFSPAFLPGHVTAFAMTIHKSQGSEFNRVMMILPNRDTRILTREIVYTGITRAKKEIGIVGRESIFKNALLRRTERTSGLQLKCF